MNNVFLLSSLGVSVIAIIYALILSRLIVKKPSGSKKMADVAKIISNELSASVKKKYQNLAMVTIVLFTCLLYAFGWALALTFLSAVVVFVAADYIAMIIAGRADIRMAEASRAGVGEAFALGFKGAAAGSLLSLGATLLAIAIVFWFAGSDLLLWGLALAVIVVSVFNWQKNSSGFFAVYITGLVTSLIFASRYFPDSASARVFPLAIFALGLLATIISSWFVGKKANISFAINKVLIISSVLFLAGSFFAIKYLLPSPGRYSTLMLFALLSAGAVLAAGALIFGRKLVILPAIMLAALVLLVNFFSNTYGVMLVLAGALALIPLEVILNLLFSSAKNAEIISQSAELPEETKNNIALIWSARISAKNYTALIGTVAVLVILFIFVDKFSVALFAISNLKLIAGFFIGVALAYFFSSDTSHDDLMALAISVLLPILASLIFGPGFLAGLLFGLILTNLLVKNINLQVLAVGITAVLSTQFIVNLYSTQIRLIILGTAIVAAAAYLIIKNLYNGRKAESEK